MAYTTIDDPSAYFKVQLYTGNGTAIGSGGNAITFNDTDTDMQPDWVWIKSRSSAEHHMLFDSVRGVTKALKTSAQDAEATGSEFLTAFGSDGFTVGSHDKVNANTVTYVAWCWKESATAGLDIVGYTGNATARTIAHNLGVVPKTVIVGDRGEANGMRISSENITGTDEGSIKLFNTAAEGTGYFPATAPDASNFSLTTHGSVNTDGSTYIAYVLAPVQGYSKFGTLTGNGAGGSNPDRDGTFVYCGFSPSLVIYKITDGTGNWVMQDTTRDGLNPSQKNIYANAVTAEGTSDGRAIDILSNGFKLRGGDFGTNKVIFMAWAEAPFVNSEGVPCNAR